MFGVTSGVLWSSGGYSFTSTGPIVKATGTATEVSLTAAGTIDDGPGGFDATGATLTIAITPTGLGIGAFGAISLTSDGPRTEPVPDSGSAIVLLGMGLGLVALGRGRFLA